MNKILEFFGLMTISDHLVSAKFDAELAKLKYTNTSAENTERLFTRLCENPGEPFMFRGEWMKVVREDSNEKGS